MLNSNVYVMWFPEHEKPRMSEFLGYESKSSRVYAVLRELEGGAK